MASKDHGLTPIELSSFCSEIALMLGAGMPLYAGMEALEKTYEDDAHAALYRGVSETLTQTGSLRDALESAHASGKINDIQEYSVGGEISPFIQWVPRSVIENPPPMPENG